MQTIQSNSASGGVTQRISAGPSAVRSHSTAGLSLDAAQVVSRSTGGRTNEAYHGPRVLWVPITIAAAVLQTARVHQQHTDIRTRLPSRRHHPGRSGAPGSPGQEVADMDWTPPVVSSRSARPAAPGSLPRRDTRPGPVARGPRLRAGPSADAQSRRTQRRRHGAQSRRQLSKQSLKPPRIESLLRWPQAPQCLSWGAIAQSNSAPSPARFGGHKVLVLSISTSILTSIRPRAREMVHWIGWALHTC